MDRSYWTANRKRCLMLAAGVACLLASLPAAADPTKNPAPATKAIVKPDGNTQIDEGTWTCRPAEFCVPSSVAGECISQKEGVKCSVSKGAPADR